MNAFARLCGVGLIVAASVGAVDFVAHPPAPPHPTLDFLQPVERLDVPPTPDDRPLIQLQPRERITFDDPTDWTIPDHNVAQVWFCNGNSDVFVGPTTVSNVCRIAFQNN